ncbi:hypothetical protein B0T25DRAFT_419465, partial [Lasiosphaeria hispida]
MPANSNSVGKQGEFHDSIPPSKPMTTKGHQASQKIGNDRKPEFHAQTFPPGTAPQEHTFVPNPISEIPGQALNPNMDPSLRTGATSQTAYKDSVYARPMEGRTHREMGGAHEIGKRKSERSGLEGTGGT